MIERLDGQDTVLEEWVAVLDAGTQAMVFKLMWLQLREHVERVCDEWERVTGEK